MGEAQRLVEIVEGLVKAGQINPSEFAVITPYAAQSALLKGMLRRLGVQVSTVDSYQGREAEIVIVSTVRCSPGRGIGFLADTRRFNVLLTRARRGLIILGHQASLAQDHVWGKWVKHVIAHGLASGDVIPPEVLPG